MEAQKSKFSFSGRGCCSNNSCRFAKEFSKMKSGKEISNAISKPRRSANHFWQHSAEVRCTNQYEKCNKFHSLAWEISCWRLRPFVLREKCAPAHMVAEPNRGFLPVGFWPLCFERLASHRTPDLDWQLTWIGGDLTRFGTDSKLGTI